MNLSPLSFSKLRSARLHLALGGAAAVGYCALTNTFSPDIITGLIRDPMLVTRIDPYVLVPPLGIAGAIFVSLRVIPIAASGVRRIKGMGIKIGSLKTSLEQAVPLGGDKGGIGVRNFFLRGRKATSRDTRRSPSSLLERPVQTMQKETIRHLKNQ